MRDDALRNRILNALSGFVSAYGVIAFICFCYLQQRWNELAPRVPNVGAGLIVPHDEHGTITYFSAFQGTSCTLLLVTGLPLFLIGLLIGPKKNILVNRRRSSINAIWDRDDPAGLWRIGTICGVIAAPVIVFVIGPYVVRWLNAMGVVTGF
jgi:hypothetical protein